MENVFEIYDMDSGLEYIKKVAPTVHDELLLELKEIADDNEIEDVQNYRKNLALGYAVLEAFESEYYYFIANVETGQTYFSATLEEHEAYQEMIKTQIADAKKEEDSAE